MMDAEEIQQALALSFVPTRFLVGGTFVSNQAVYVSVTGPVTWANGVSGTGGALQIFSPSSSILPQGDWNDISELANYFSNPGGRGPAQ